MITFEELKRISDASGLHLYQQEKEYLLKLFIYYYYQKYEDAIFKGGTYIRFLLGLDRFSEDLDFNIVISPKEFAKEVENTLKQLNKIGIATKFKKAEFFKDSFTAQIIFNGPLYKGSSQTQNKISIDAGKRIGTLVNPEWKVISSKFPETKNKFTVLAMDLEEILCEKIIAAFSREKGRDLYDIWFLTESGVMIDKILLKKKLKGKRLDKKMIVSEEKYTKDITPLTKRIIPYKVITKKLFLKLRGFFT